MGKLSRLGNDLYDGDVSIDFVGRKWLWYTISGIIVVLAVAGLYFKGLNFGIEFEGGVEYNVSVAAGQVTQANVDKIAHRRGRHRHRRGRLTDREHLRRDDPRADRGAQQRRGRPGRPTRSPRRSTSTPRTTSRPPRWARAGVSRSRKRALTGLVVFLILVVLFIWAYFREWKMSVAAIVALIHDIVITDRHLRALRVRGHAGDRHRSADHPRLLALRHRRRLRQGAGEHQEPAPEPAYVRRAGQPRGQPDAGALDQHLDRRAAPGRRDPLRQRRHAGLGRAQGPGAGPVRRHGRRCLLVDLHRDPARRTAEVEREGDHPAGRPRQGARPPGRRPLRRRARRSPTTCRCTTRTTTSTIRTPTRATERPARAPRRPEASGSGRVVPTSKKPLGGTGSAGRAQPTRQPRSKRGK